MGITVHTHAEIEAINLCSRVGIIPMSTNADPGMAVNYILGLAERIKNERANTTMQLAARSGE